MAVQEVCGFRTEMPLGVQLNGGGAREREFSVLKSSWLTQQIVANDALKTDRTYEWYARLISSFVESIGGEPVFKVFEKTERVPDIVHRIPLVDVGYILALGHMFTYGARIDVGRQRCPYCGKGVEYTLSLRKIRVDPSEHVNPDQYVVQLPTGWTAEEPDKDERMRRHYQGKTWNRWIIRPATLSDGIDNSKYLTRIHASTFEFMVYAQCTIGVESWAVESADDPDDPPVQTIKLDEMTSQDLQLKNAQIIPTLDGRDHAAMRRAEAGLPQVRLAVEHDCGNCGEAFGTRISLGSFFPRV